MSGGVRSFDLGSSARGVLLALLAVLAAAPAFGQSWPNDLISSQFIDATYQIDGKWALNFYGELRENHNISAMDNSIFRPNVQYWFAPHWGGALGYVQFQPWQPPFNADRGPFEDLYYRNNFGDLGVLSRLRFNETFADRNSAMWVVPAYLLSFVHPIGHSAWFANLSDEVYVSLKADYTGHKTGFLENKAFFGFGHPLASHATLTAGYELDSVNYTSPTTLHNLRFGVSVRF